MQHSQATRDCKGCRECSIAGLPEIARDVENAGIAGLPDIARGVENAA